MYAGFEQFMPISICRISIRVLLTKSVKLESNFIMKDMITSQILDSSFTR